MTGIEGLSFIAVHNLQLKEDKVVLGNKAHTAGLQLSFRSNVSSILPSWMGL